MKDATLAMTCAVAGLALGLVAPSATADGDQNKRLSVTVSFGAGLNTAQQANQHILPKEIRVRTGGVVNFVVGGIPSSLCLQHRDRTQGHRRTRLSGIHQ